MTRSRSRLPLPPALRAAPLLAAAAVALAPSAARPGDPSAEIAARAPDAAAGPEVVAEALFMADHLPPGGRDVNLSLAVQDGEPDPETGEAPLALYPRLQLALAITDRIGFTADTGFATEGEMLDTPGASLKFLLREPAPGRTGLAASVDLFGSLHSAADSEAGLGLGAIRSFGRLALRAGATVATGVSAWAPHLHAGASAALALGSRWRALVEVVADVTQAGAVLAAGPTVKVALGEATALMAGALFPVDRPGAPTSVVVQLTQGL